MFEKDEYSLATAIVELASNSEKLFGIECDVQCSKFVRLYNKAALIHLYRIAQEAITNAARHAKPEIIQIRLSKKDNNITMKIRDDGTGFALPKHLDGMGLEIMKYRAHIIDAWLDIRPDSNKGTVVECIFCDKPKKEVNITEKTL
jgi:signal transduction histidine kinase